MFDSIGFEITADTPASFTTPLGGQYVIISIHITNMDEVNSTKARWDLLDATGNILSTPVKKLPLDAEETQVLDTKLFVSNGKSVLFSTPSTLPVSITVSYYKV